MKLPASGLPPRCSMDFECEFHYADPYYGKLTKTVRISGLALEAPVANAALSMKEEKQDGKTNPEESKGPSGGKPADPTVPAGGIRFSKTASVTAVFIALLVALLSIFAIAAKRKEKADQPEETAEEDETREIAAGKDDEPPKAAPLVLEIGLDRKTSFPCVRTEGGQWVHLLPITKLQVEQWIYEGGLESFSPELANNTILRLEYSRPGQKDPECLKTIRRTPVNRLGPRQIRSVIATNLTMWSKEDEIVGEKTAIFPTKQSEWGRFSGWLNGSFPEETVALEWRERFGSVSSKELLRKVLGKVPPGRLPRAVDRLLRVVAEGLEPSDRGLPFSRNGVWELTKRAVRKKRLSGGGVGVTLSHPLAVGDTDFWPYFQNGGQSRELLQRYIPMAGARLVLSDVEELGEKVEVEPCDPADASANHCARDDQAPAENAEGMVAKPVKGPITMANRCPLCYELVERGVWRSDANIFCASAKVKNKDEEDAVTKRIHTVHEASRQNGPNLRVVSEQRINNDYRKVAKQRPALVRPVTLSGYSQQGKSCFLLSMMGNLLYPDGDNAFERMFPEKLGLIQFLTAMTAINNEDRLNIYRHLEEMWVDGNLPLPNNIEKALSSPVYFRSNGSWPRKSRELLLIFNDIAGEAMGPNLGLEPEFPHVACSRDVIYLVDARELNNSYSQFLQATQGLNAAVFEGKIIDLKKVNLIFCCSKIDALQSGSADDKGLLSICTEGPCQMPSNRDPGEFEAYIDGMKKVSENIRAHLRKRRRNLVTHAENSFASVRYCGFSSFGYRPLSNEYSTVPDSHGCLPSMPRPIRVVDPLLWILLDQGMIRL